MNSLYDPKKLSKEEHDFLLQFLEFNLYDLEYYNTENNTNSLREKFEALYQSAFNDLNLFISKDVKNPLQIIIVHSHIRLLNTPNFHGEDNKRVAQDFDNQIKPKDEIIIPHPDIVGHLSLQNESATILACQNWKEIYKTALKQAGLWLVCIHSDFEQCNSRFDERLRVKWISSMKFLNDKIDSLVDEKSVGEMVEPEMVNLNTDEPGSFLFSFQSKLEKKIYETGFTFKEFFPVKFNQPVI